MEGWMIWKHRLLIALSSLAWFACDPPLARAEWICSAASPEQAAQIRSMIGTQKSEAYVPGNLEKPVIVSNAREDAQAMMRGLHRAWEDLRHEALATALAMFFIRGGTPPTTTPSDPGTTAKPPKQTGGTSTNTNPPDPTGSGEFGPTDPGAPPVSTPEPASLALALLGGSLAAGYHLRRRRRTA